MKNISGLLMHFCLENALKKTHSFFIIIKYLFKFYLHLFRLLHQQSIYSMDQKFEIANKHAYQEELSEW